jgi:hypothetical protein
MITGNGAEVKRVVVDMWGLSTTDHKILCSGEGFEKFFNFLAITREPMFKFDVRESAPATGKMWIYSAGVSRSHCRPPPDGGGSKNIETKAFMSPDRQGGGKRGIAHREFLREVMSQAREYPSVPTAIVR